MPPKGAGLPTIRQVSVEADVSVATVSRVLNGSRPVDPALAEKVREAARRLNYQLNPVAQALGRGRMRTVGVVVPDLANPYFNQLLKHLAAAAASEDYRLLVADSNMQPDEELALCHQMLRQCEGIVLCSPRMPAKDVDQLLTAERPVIWVGRQIRNRSVPSVLVDSFEAMRDVRAHLEQLGHRRAVYLSGQRLSWSQVQRWKALRTPRKNGLECASVQAGGTIDDGYRAVDQALAHTPSALVCFNDLVAFGALARLSELGVRVPDEVSVSGFDDIPFASFATPSLTTTSSPTQDLGRHAWSLFVRALEERTKPSVVTFRPHLSVRSSTGPPMKAER